MSVQARFFVQAITTYAGNNGGQVVLAPVSRGSENKTWASATPSGRIEMNVNNPAAFKWFQERLSQDVAILFEDRPALCEVCGEEVVAGYDQPQERQGVTDYGTDAKLFRHQGCQA